MQQILRDLSEDLLTHLGDVHGCDLTE